MHCCELSLEEIEEIDCCCQDICVASPEMCDGCVCKKYDSDGLVRSLIGVIENKSTQKDRYNQLKFLLLGMSDHQLIGG